MSRALFWVTVGGVVAILDGWVSGVSLSRMSLAVQQAHLPEARFVPLRPLQTDSEVIFGDPEAAGQPFVMRIRELPGTIIPPHSHPVDEHITVVEGTFFLPCLTRST